MYVYVRFQASPSPNYLAPISNSSQSKNVSCSKAPLSKNLCSTLSPFRRNLSFHRTLLSTTFHLIRFHPLFLSNVNSCLSLFPSPTFSIPYSRSVTAGVPVDISQLPSSDTFSPSAIHESGSHLSYS